MDRHDDAYLHLEQAQDLFGRVGNLVDQGYTYIVLAWAFGQQDRDQEALDEAGGQQQRVLIAGALALHPDT